MNLSIPQRLIKSSVSPIAAVSILANYFNGKPTLDYILYNISAYFHVSKKKIKSKKRDREIVEARRIYCFFASRHYTLNEVAFFIRIDHATVIHHRDKAFDLLSVKSEKELIEKTKQVAKAIYGISELPTREDFQVNYNRDEVGRFSISPKKYVHC